MWRETRAVKSRAYFLTFFSQRESDGGTSPPLWEGFFVYFQLYVWKLVSWHAFSNSQTDNRQLMWLVRYSFQSHGSLIRPGRVHFTLKGSLAVQLQTKLYNVYICLRLYIICLRLSINTANGTYPEDIIRSFISSAAERKKKRQWRFNWPKMLPMVSVFKEAFLQISLSVCLSL